jgi:hypothetical protein
MTDPDRPSLRTVLDAHEWMTDTEDHECACGWQAGGEPESWFAEWADHREQAVRAWFEADADRAILEALQRAKPRPWPAATPERVEELAKAMFGLAIDHKSSKRFGHREQAQRILAALGGAE